MYNLTTHSKSGVSHRLLHICFLYSVLLPSSIGHSESHVGTETFHVRAWLHFLQA
jgi:hypothetical protein